MTGCRTRWASVGGRSGLTISDKEQESIKLKNKFLRMELLLPKFFIATTARILPGDKAWKAVQNSVSGSRVAAMLC